MTGRDPVDFVVGADEPPADPLDEELTQTPPRALKPLWALGAGVVVVAAAVALVHRDGGTPVSAPSAPSASQSVFRPPPDVVGVTQPVQVPEGNRSARPLPDCPPGAECYADTAVPGSTLAALRHSFPSAQVTSATSVLADRLGRFGPDLVSRLVHARAGSVDITLTAHKPERGDRNRYSYDRAGQLLHSVDTYSGTAFTVTVEIEQLGPKHRPSHAVLDRIARDSRLVVPQ